MAAAMKQTSSNAAEPELTTSADGNYYDLELTPGVTSKPSRLSTELLAASSQPDADTWLSSPDMDMEGLEGSWDSVSKHDLPGSGWSNPLFEAPNKIQALTTPGGDSAKARAWLRGQGKSPARPSSANSEEESWKIAAGVAQAAPVSAPEAATPRPTKASREQSQSPASSVGPTPVRSSLMAGQQAGSPAPSSSISVPSPAHDFPRSFAVLQEEPALPSGSGSFKAWLNEEDGETEGGSDSELSVEEDEEEAAKDVVAAKAAATAAAAAAAVKQQEEEAKAAAVVEAAVIAEEAAAVQAQASCELAATGGFASPISLAGSPSPTPTPCKSQRLKAASPAVVHAAAAAIEAEIAHNRASPNARTRIDIGALLCVLVAMAALAAAAFAVPVGFTAALVSPARVSSSSYMAIFPHGFTTPRLPAHLLPFNWGPAWLLPANPAAPEAASKATVPAAAKPSQQPQARAPSAADAFKAAAKALRAQVPLPLSWVKPKPSVAEMLGTSSLSKQAASTQATPMPGPKPAGPPAAKAAIFASQATPAPQPTAQPAAAKSTMPAAAPKPDVPAATPEPAAPVTASKPAAPTLTPAPAPARPAPLKLSAREQIAASPAAVTAQSLSRHMSAAREHLAAYAARLQQWALAAGLFQPAGAVLSSVPLPSALASAATATPQVWSAVGAVTVAAALFGRMVAALLAGNGGVAEAAAATGEAETAEDEEGESPLREVGRPGVKSLLFSHMKLQRPPTTTPAVGGRAWQRRQSAVNAAEVAQQPGGDELGLPSLAPTEAEPQHTATKSYIRREPTDVPAPTPRTATRSMLTRRAAMAAAGGEDGVEVASATPATVRRSRRLAM